MSQTALRAVVVGDVLVDRFTEDLRAVHPWRHRSSFALTEGRQPGGAWRTAEALRRLGAEVEVATLTSAGGIEAPWRLTDLAPGSERPPVERIWLSHRGETIQINAADRYGESTDETAVRPATASPDLIVVQDYGHGSAQALRGWLEDQAAAGTPIVWDGHPLGPPPPAGVVVVMDRSRFSFEVGASTFDFRSAAASMAEWVEMHRVSALALTLGAGGCLVADERRGESYACTVFESDRKQVGAGDAFAGSLGLQLCHEDDVRVAAMGALADASRLLSEDDLPAQLLHHDSRPSVDRVPHVVTTGCFDLLHLGHASLLSSCRRMGRHVTVLLNEDRSVQRLKGPDRPFNDFATRADALMDTGLVDRVVGFAADTPDEALAQVPVDVYVKGADYDIRSIPEADLVRARGARVVTVPLVPGISTSGIEQRVRANGAGAATPTSPAVPGV